MGGDREIVVDDLLSDFVGNKLLLVGRPGTGKSMILQYLQVASAKNNCQYYPIRISFRELVSLNSSLEAWVADALTGELGGGLELFDRRVHTAPPRLLILLDGLDEVSDVDCDKVSQEILQFAVRNPGVRTIVTSRPEGFREESFSTFEQFDVLPLSEPQIRTYVERVVPEQYRERIWNTIHSHPRIYELAATPFLLALMCAAHKELGPRANQRASLYRTCIRFLLRAEDWDPKRPKIGRMEEDYLLKALKFMAVRFFKLDYVDNFSEIEIIQNISLIPGYQTEAKRVLNTIVERTGLLQFDRNGYQFVHRSVWEYLVAEGCRDESLSVLIDRCNQRQWEEPIRLYVGLLPSAELPPALSGIWERNPTLALRAMMETTSFPDDILASLYNGIDLEEKKKLLQELRLAVDRCATAREQARILVDTASALVRVDRDAEVLFSLLIMLERVRDQDAVDLRAKILQSAALDERLQGYMSDPSYYLDFVRVSRGQYVMGCDALHDGSPADNSEKPAHPVEVDGFWISRHLVCNALFYHAFPYAVDRRNEYSNGDRQPVNNVNWYEAMLFAAWLGCDLATDAEWEYAARSGGADDNTIFDPAQISQIAWYGANSGNKTHAVGTKSPNAWGLFDVAGNLREWCRDWFDESYYKECLEKGVVRNPIGPNRGDKKVLRGGTFDWAITNLRPTYRNSNNPNNRSHVTGFRLVVRNSELARRLGLEGSSC